MNLPYAIPAGLRGEDWDFDDIGVICNRTEWFRFKLTVCADVSSRYPEVHLRGLIDRIINGVGFEDESELNKNFPFMFSFNSIANALTVNYIGFSYDKEAIKDFYWDSGCAILQYNIERLGVVANRPAISEAIEVLTSWTWYGFRHSMFEGDFDELSYGMLATIIEKTYKDKASADAWRKGFNSCGEEDKALIEDYWDLFFTIVCMHQLRGVKIYGSSLQSRIPSRKRFYS